MPNMFVKSGTPLRNESSNPYLTH